MTLPPAQYTECSTVSKDGTDIGYLRTGTGPGVVLIHGGMQAAQHMMGLSAALSDFTCYAIDRRGRGSSGSYGSNYSVAKDCEDVAAVLADTGAQFIFGLSSGALVALRTALNLPRTARIALYEPPLSIDGSIPRDWVDRYDREVSQGKLADALVTTLKGIKIEPSLARIPRFILVPLLSLSINAKSTPNCAAAADLIPTQHFDMKIVADTADTTEDYTVVEPTVLLLGGTRSPKFLKRALDKLELSLPHCRRHSFAGLGHDGPSIGGKPEVVAQVLRAFFDEAND